MFDNLIFVGGIHGVGKSTICKKVCYDNNLIYLSASEIIRWDKIKKNPKEKSVPNIGYTQNLLLEGLKSRIKKENSYLLDGHLCLLNSMNKVERIPKDVFKEIKPKIVAVVTDKPEFIMKRLSQRDNLKYESILIEDMQQNELNYAKEITEELNIPFIEIKEGNVSNLIKLINT